MVTEDRMRLAALGGTGLVLSSTISEARASMPAGWVNLNTSVVCGYNLRHKFHRMICVFRRCNSRAEVHDAGNWNGPVVKP
jgi:hypothetical protein